MKWAARFVVILLALSIASGQAAPVIKAVASTAWTALARMSGRRSAYNNGGASPICYERDVTQKMVDDSRKKASLRPRR